MVAGGGGGGFNGDTCGSRIIEYPPHQVFPYISRHNHHSLFANLTLSENTQEEGKSFHTTTLLAQFLFNQHSTPFLQKKLKVLHLLYQVMDDTTQRMLSR
ncbi:unnamed protein product [Lactuca virosa]|uniref:Uncharacterized protein n=1 Tax=Lactuca virosa TaxID=75947 RepID=A0AAU9LN19_9ASTR|nr:unnamed protein product [Lactuca virosa]